MSYKDDRHKKAAKQIRQRLRADGVKHMVTSRATPKHGTIVSVVIFDGNDKTRQKYEREFQGLASMVGTLTIKTELWGKNG